MRYRYLFLATELLALLAIMAGLRAVDLSESVSLVSVIECARPVLVMLFSLLCLAVLRQLRGTRARVGARQALREQLAGSGGKLASSALIVGGVTVISFAAA